ncbi:MAG TPA: YgaP-like transmembrane domain [Candidatus Acidoferrales bacterium]
MAAVANISGLARMLYLVAGVGVVSWGLRGADSGWTQWAWLILGGLLMVLGAIGYSPISTLFSRKQEKAI